MAASPAPTASRRSGSSLYTLYLLAIAATLVGNLALRLGARAGWLPPLGEAVVAVIVSVPLTIAAWLFWRAVRRDVDEMFQRIVFEGMAFALTVYVPLAALFVNLRTAGVWTPRLDATDLLLAPALLVALGVELARRRYA